MLNVCLKKKRINTFIAILHLDVSAYTLVMDKPTISSA